MRSFQPDRRNREDSPPSRFGTGLAFPAHDMSREDTMDGWLAALVEPLYGIVDLFLDQPLAAVLSTSVAALLIAATILSFR
jgi:hypothetical protein